MATVALVVAVVAVVAVGSARALAQTKPTLSQRIEQCAQCHGANGNATLEKMPSLAGQPEMFLINQLVLIREGVRPIEAMTPFVKDLTDDEIQALATHYAGLIARRSQEPVDAAKVERGKVLSKWQRCASCHAPMLVGQEQIPRLAGQRIDYLVKSMMDIRDNRRRGADSNMTAAVAGVSDNDLTALAHYAATR